MKRRLPLEADLVPFVPGFPPGRRWLVLAPHPDDEVFGPGATLALAVHAGIEVKVVILTDGAAQGEPGVRAAEGGHAATVLGISEPERWGLPDRSLHPHDVTLRTKLSRELLASGAETVLLPSPVELHPDHRAVALAVQQAIRRLTLGGLLRRGPSHLACYEVSAAMLPNLLVVADARWDVKRAAAACYASQLAVWPYLEVAEGLGAFRALTLAGARRAEAFHVTACRDVARWSTHRWAGAMGSPRCVQLRPVEWT